jgi:Putative zinc-finger
MVVNCEHVWSEISNYVDGEVDPALRAAMEEHFKGCKHCTAVLDGTRNVVQLYGDDRLFELPAGFSQRLQRRIAQKASSSSLRSARSLWMLAVAATAVIAGGLALGNAAAFRNPSVRSLLARPPHGVPASLMVAVCDDGKVFHAPGCKYLHKHGDEGPKMMTAGEAMREGYTPCVRCLRQYLDAANQCPRPGPTYPLLALHSSLQKDGLEFDRTRAGRFVTVIARFELR